MEIFRKVAPALIILTSLAGCQKYDQNQPSPSTAKPTETAGGPSATAPASNGQPAASEAKEFKYDPALKVVMKCDLNSVGPQGLEPKKPAELVAGEKGIYAGWVVKEDGTPPDMFNLVLKGEKDTFAIDAVTGLDRPDVAQAVGSNAMKSGFAFTPDTSKVPPGTYSVFIVDAASKQACDTTKILTFK